ncbi:hypothetical protein BHE74_00041804 [Ensete ventricosum]|nr:hypothetical protein BHE74_00041804 [Ensete ventricosum]
MARGAETFLSLTLLLIYFTSGWPWSLALLSFGIANAFVKSSAGDFCFYACNRRGKSAVGAGTGKSERTVCLRRSPTRTLIVVFNLNRLQKRNMEIVADMVTLLQKTWCVAKPSSDDATLLENINYVCSQVDCSVLQRGFPCFYPDNLMSHASIAMNLYYQSRGRNPWNCFFNNSALVVTTDPSKAKVDEDMVLSAPIYRSRSACAGYGSCAYA